MKGYLIMVQTILLGIVAVGWSQPAPFGEKQPYFLDTGWLKADGEQVQKVFETVIRWEGAHAMRLYFDEVHLSPGGWIEVRSLFDNEVQRLTPAMLAFWHNTTAFFNGDALQLALYAEPNSQARLVIRQIWIDRGEAYGSDFVPAEGQCSTCGNARCTGACKRRRPACVEWTGDCQTLHGNCHQWSGRLAPMVCSASIINRYSCIITAGHCIMIAGSPLEYVIQFNVPPSVNCVPRHPPVNDQFPAVQHVYFFNWGIDFAVVVPGPNSAGELPYQRYGQCRRPVPYNDLQVGQDVAIYGYGIWTGEGAECRTLTLQYDTGYVTGFTEARITALAETDVGNSGSGILRLSDERLVGISWSCAGPYAGGTRTSYWEFVRARRMLCPTPGDVNEDGIVDDADLLLVLLAFGQECPLLCIEDLNDDGVVDDGDLLIVLLHFGYEY